jgi:hypothetical protein
MSDFSEPEKVRILLSEYAALKAEIMARTGHGYQITGFFLTALAIFATQGFSWKVGIYLAAVVAVLAFALWFTWRDIHKASRRIREIELDVNDRAGEDLLVWEHLFGNLWGGLRMKPWTIAADSREVLKNMSLPERTFKGGPLLPPQSN